MKFGFNLILIFIVLSLSSCSNYGIKKEFDPELRRSVCYLKDIRLKYEGGGWNAARSTYFAAELLANGYVKLYFFVGTVDRARDLHANPKVIIRAFDEREAMKEWKFTASTAGVYTLYDQTYKSKGETKLHFLVVPVVMGQGVASYSFIEVSRDVFRRIAFAKSLTILLETNSDPIKFEGSISSLSEFSKVCNI